MEIKKCTICGEYLRPGREEGDEDFCPECEDRVELETFPKLTEKQESESVDSWDISDLEDSGHRTCPSCNGRSYEDPEHYECKHCNGSGEIFLDCSTNDDKTNQAIASYAKSHSYYNLPKELEELNPVSTFRWGNQPPDSIDYEDSKNNGASSDTSTIFYYTSAEYAIYTYNNNAWGCCNVIAIADDPGGIREWINEWDDELPEKWMKKID